MGKSLLVHCNSVLERILGFFLIMYWPNNNFRHVTLLFMSYVHTNADVKEILWKIKNILRNNGWWDGIITH